ncbi:hypothetical protein ATANTOWER_018170 [Ataeniobius toweri]|uniref:Ig-like domain-containing protein n=1 Tax=Ataeniobius toweri TaxID=208326 RepID=A0ABU7BG96_9TELE|nr:hypothetical protein [Ataeniobius toweri]
MTFFSCVSSCDYNCPDKPVLTPSRLVVKYGDPTSAICVACQKDCLPLEESVIGMEASRGKTTINGTTLTWKVDHLREWEFTPKCFYTNKNNKQCCTTLSVTVYQPPEAVLISSLGPNGQVLDCGQAITLQCSVHKVAPARDLIVNFYRGQTQLGHMKSKSTVKEPVNETFTFSYKTSKDDDKAQFWCEAVLDLEPGTTQPFLVVKSGNLTTTVHCKPEGKKQTQFSPQISPQV